MVPLIAESRINVAYFIWDRRGSGDAHCEYNKIKIITLKFHTHYISHRKTRIFKNLESAYKNKIKRLKSVTYPHLHLTYLAMALLSHVLIIQYFCRT